MVSVEARKNFLESFSTLNILRNDHPSSMRKVSVEGALQNLDQTDQPNIQHKHDMLIDFEQFEGRSFSLDFFKFDEPMIRDLVVHLQFKRYKFKLTQKYYKERLENHTFFFASVFDTFNLFVN